MDKDVYDLHITAGLKAGKDRTCGKKINYITECSAEKAVTAMNKKTYPKVLEHYPCAFCNGWHIGRKMSEEELRT